MTDTMRIFIDNYNETYKFLYNNVGKDFVNVCESILNQMSDDSMNENDRDFIKVFKAFCKETGDVPVSDREVAAFTSTYIGIIRKGLLDKLLKEL